MEVVIRHDPSFAVGRIILAAGEQVQAESGAMMATSPGVSIESSTRGGVLKGLKRSVLGGESLFVTTFTAPGNGGWVDVAHHLSGDVVVREVTAAEPMSITRGCWLASARGVELDTKWGGFKNLFGGEGGFLIRASGQGAVLLACYGALDTISLGPGESVTVDTGHVVACSRPQPAPLVGSRSCASTSSPHAWLTWSEMTMSCCWQCACLSSTWPGLLRGLKGNGVGKRDAVLWSRRGRRGPSGCARRDQERQSK